MAKGRKTGGGSRKGIPNKVGADVREMVYQALVNVGGVEYLEKMAQESKSAPAFLALLGKTLPKDVNVNTTGKLTLSISLSNGERRG